MDFKVLTTGYLFKEIHDNSDPSTTVFKVFAVPSPYACFACICLLDFSAGRSPRLLYDPCLGIDVLGSLVLVVGVSSAAALTPV